MLVIAEDLPSFPVRHLLPSKAGPPTDDGVLPNAEDLDVVRQLWLHWLGSFKSNLIHVSSLTEVEQQSVTESTVTSTTIRPQRSVIIRQDGEVDVLAHVLI